MADPKSGTDAHPDRRRRRNQRKRRLVRRVGAVLAGGALTLAFVLLATDVVRPGGGERPSLADTVHRASRAHEVAATTTTVAGRPCRTLSTTDPLRLWVGGDSLAGSLGPALGTITGATGVVQPYFDSRVSSGLANPGFFDWPDHATTEMARLSPEIAVFIIGANDWTAVTGSDASKADYANLVENMLKILIGSGRTVYWVGAPTLRDTTMDAGVAEANAVAADAVKRHPEAQYVDAYKLFSDRDGKFSFNLADETGKVATMRAGDGVHLTTDGGDYLARAVYKLVDTQCHVTAQKVAGATKATIETEGSTQVAPGSSGSGSGSGSGSSRSGTIATTPPATAPPTTQPPVTTTAPPTTTPPTTTAPPTTTTKPPTQVTVP